MKKIVLWGAAMALVMSGGVVIAQEGIGRNDPDGNYRPLTEGLKVIGGFDFSESCSYDETRGVIVAPNMGNRTGDGFFNDGWVSLINHDGSVHTLQWIVSNEDTGAYVNDPFGSDIQNGVLYMADRKGGTGEGDPQVATVTMWNMETGEWVGEYVVPDSTGFNDIEVAADGTVYASQTGSNDDPNTWQIWRITPDGEASIIVQGEPLARPNGVAIDGDGNIVVVNINSADVQTFTPDGELLDTRQVPEAGNDGIVIMEDGTIYISSVRFGSIQVLAPDGTSEIIAVGMPGGASMCYDPDGHQLVVPMNNANALVFVPLGM